MPILARMASAEGYLAGDSIQQSRRYLEAAKGLGICWFKSNSGHQRFLLEQHFWRQLKLETLTVGKD